MTHICVGKLTIIGSDNGLSPGRRQAIIRTNAGILLIGTLGTNLSEILSEILTFSFKKMHLKMSSGRWCPICLGLNVLNGIFHLVCHTFGRNIMLLVSLAHFLSLPGSKLILCSPNHGPDYWSSLPCEWPRTAWADSKLKAKDRQQALIPYKGTVLPVQEFQLRR